MISHLLCQHPLTCFFSKDMDLSMKPLKNQFLDLFFRYCCFFFLIPNLLFFCYFLYLYYSFVFFSISLFSASSLLPSASAILVFSTLASTAFHTLLDISSSLSFLFSSYFQDHGKLTTVFPKSHSISAHQSHLSLFFFYVTSNKYSPLLYA